MPVPVTGRPTSVGPKFAFADNGDVVVTLPSVISRTVVRPAGSAMLTCLQSPRPIGLGHATLACESVAVVALVTAAMVVPALIWVPVTTRPTSFFVPQP